MPNTKKYTFIALSYREPG